MSDKGVFCNIAINKLTINANHIHLSISSSKSATMVFSLRPFNIVNVTSACHNSPIPIVSKFKLLGITLDPRLGLATFFRLYFSDMTIFWHTTYPTHQFSEHQFSDITLFRHDNVSNFFFRPLTPQIFRNTIFPTRHYCDKTI